MGELGLIGVDMEQRILNNAKTLIETNGTVRQVAEVNGCSKSTVYLDLTKRLHYVANNEIITIVNEIIQRNKKEKHFRGGQATKQLYEKGVL